MRGSTLGEWHARCTAMSARLRLGNLNTSERTYYEQSDSGALCEASEPYDPRGRPGPGRVRPAGLLDCSGCHRWREQGCHRSYHRLLEHQRFVGVSLRRTRRPIPQHFGGKECAAVSQPKRTPLEELSRKKEQRVLEPKGAVRAPRQNA